MDPVYLDYAATTPLNAQVLSKMLPYFSETFGNPSSVHVFGQRAEAALENAREQVASSLNARAEEIVFTSGGTESDNLALRGAAHRQRSIFGKKHILVSPVEHPAVLTTARQLAREEGFDLEYLEVDENGWVDPGDVEARIRPDTALVSVIYANNEIGTINPIAQIGEVCHRKGVIFHSDAVQAAAHLKMDVLRDRVDLLSVGAHKFYGPKGVGVLYIRRGVEILPLQTGGKQENAMRAGTSNIPYIVGLAEALCMAQAGCEERAKRYVTLRDNLIAKILTAVPRSKLTGLPANRLPNHASFVFEEADGNLLLMLLDAHGFACSSGSACKVGNPTPSEILTSIGLSATWALGSLRVTFGNDTTGEQLSRFVDVLPGLVEKARKAR
jgi:cysteine desulfurase